MLNIDIYIYMLEVTHKHFHTGNKDIPIGQEVCYHICIKTQHAFYNFSPRTEATSISGILSNHIELCITFVYSFWIKKSKCINLENLECYETSNCYFLPFHLEFFNNTSCLGKTMSLCSVYKSRSICNLKIQNKQLNRTQA